MNNFNPDKKYEAFKIPERSRSEDNKGTYSFEQKRCPSAPSKQGDIFYEIEYDTCPLPGVGKFVLKSQKVEEPVRDEIRELFYRMRDIAHDYRPVFYASSKFYDVRVQKETSRVFYNQAIFMKDFVDQYEKEVPYSSYYPNYQMMGYDQLRTYFTWRTLVRQGNVTKISLSYAYLYIYELLSNIGTEEPQEGLEKLLFFWRAFREWDTSIDKYVVKWLKDYYIYYDFPGSFQEFLTRYELAEFYPELEESEDLFELYCGISKYDIRKSHFYTEDKITLIKACFEHTLDRLIQLFKANGMSFEEAIFQPGKKMAVWVPFKGALFYDWKNQRDRKVVLSKKEIYICNHNDWTCSSVVITESAKKLIGYVMKQMEVVLRKLTKYKFKLSADLGTVNHDTVMMLNEIGISLEKVVTDAVTEVYRNATRTVVKVDPGMLARIREEALVTQEKLTVPEEDAWSFGLWQAEEEEKYEEVLQIEENQQQTLEGLFQGERMGPWQELHASLTETEMQALVILCTGNGDIRGFADAHGIMPEVLMDGINEKAMDAVGDSLTDDEFVIYEDYIAEVREMVEGL